MWGWMRKPWHASVMRKGFVIRSGGYLALFGGCWALLLAVSVVAFVDPALKNEGDPDWMFWLWACCLAGALTRAPFVGLVIRDGQVIHRSWMRSRSWAARDIVGVTTAGYSGLVNWYSPSGRFLMIVLATNHGSIIEVPEVSGAPVKMTKRLHRLAGALDLPTPSILAVIAAIHSRMGPPDAYAYRQFDETPSTRHDRTFRTCPTPPPVGAPRRPGLAGDGPLLERAWSRRVIHSRVARSAAHRVIGGR